VTLKSPSAEVFFPRTPRMIVFMLHQQTLSNCIDEEMFWSGWHIKYINALPRNVSAFHETADKYIQNPLTSLRGLIAATLVH